MVKEIVVGRNDGVGSKQASLSKGCEKNERVGPREASSGDRWRVVNGQVKGERIRILQRKW